MSPFSCSAVVKKHLINASSFHDEEVLMLKFVLSAIACVAMVGAAVAADLPRREPPPPVAPVGKAPKAPFGKGPVVARY